jgi:ATP-binding cassette subfamily F protein 3
VVVSHDREFLDGLVDRIYEFRDGGVREYLGDIWYFLEKRKVESLQEIERKERPATTEKSTPDNNAGKLSYEQKKEQEKILRKLRKTVESIEEELSKVESEIAEYDKRFAEATDYNADDYAKYDALKQRYDHLMHEWEKASYELEITEQN